MKSRIDGCETPEYEEGQRERIERDPLRALEQLGKIEADQAETAAAVAETSDPEGPSQKRTPPPQRRKKWRAWERPAIAEPPRRSLNVQRAESDFEVIIESRIRSRADLAKHAGGIIYGLVTEDNKSDYERLSMGDMFEPGMALALEVHDYHGMPMIKLKIYQGVPKISLTDQQIAHYNLYAQSK